MCRECCRCLVFKIFSLMINHSFTLYKEHPYTLACQKYAFNVVSHDNVLLKAMFKFSNENIHIVPEGNPPRFPFGTMRTLIVDVTFVT